MALDTRRRNLVVVSNEQTPYRLHFHKRIVREIPEYRLWSIFTHDVAASSSGSKDLREINAVLFGEGDQVCNQARAMYAWKEWDRGGRVIEWLKDRGASTVIVNGYNDLGRLRILSWCRREGIPAYLFGDSNILCDRTGGPLSWLKSATLPRILKLSSGLLCCGSLGRQYFTKYGVSAEKVWDVPYEPDYAELESVSASARQAVLEKYGLRKNCIRVLFCGRLERVKRVDLLIAAFAELASERQDLELVLAGDGALRTSLEAMVPMSLRDRVVWTGFVSNRSELSALYGVSDVFVLPSEYEPWGVVVSEAAVRLALVVSSVVGAGAELVKEGVNGYTFRTGDAVDLTSALRRATASGALTRLKRSSPRVLSEWRAKADPIRNLRSALGLPPTVEVALLAGMKPASR